MKKSIIAAGAASIALAAMPVVSTFAATDPVSVTDNLSVKINNTCSVSRTAAVGGTGDNAGTWTEGTQLYSTEMAAGETAILGTSTIRVVCNDTTNGFYLTAGATGLTGTGGTIAYSGAEVSTAANTWNIAVSEQTGISLESVTGGYITMTEGAANIYGSSSAKKTTAVDGTFKATYNVGTMSTLPAGTYTGAATYTLTYGN